MTWVPDPKKTDPDGPLQLKEPKYAPSLDGMRWYIKEATIGPEDGYGMPFAHVTDHGRVTDPNQNRKRYGVTIGAGAKQLGIVDTTTHWFDTWHDATEAALAFARSMDKLKRARSELSFAEQQAAAALDPTKFHMREAESAR